VAYGVTLGTLIQRVRQRANLEGSQAFIPDSEVIDNLNQSIADWYDMVRLSTFGGQYFRVQYPFTTTANRDAYPLPLNMASEISVDAIISGAQTKFDVRRFQEEDRNIFNLVPLVGWIWNQPIWYQLWGPNIVFRPIPDGSYSVTLNYVPTAPVLNDPANDSLDSINGWEEWIVLDSAVKCLIKDGQLDIIPLLEARRQEQAVRIQAAAPQRSMNASEGVHETRRWGSSWDE
jgi:hypothetical protein